MKLRRRTIQLCEEFSLESSEAQMVHTQRDSGKNRDEMVAIWLNHMKSSPEEAALRVDYYLGNIGSEEFIKHLSPKEPQSITFHGKDDGNYWLKAHGTDAEFDVVLVAPALSESAVKSLLANHQEDLCWLAYKNSFERQYAPRQLENGAAATPILVDDINPLLT